MQIFHKIVISGELMQGFEELKNSEMGSFFFQVNTPGPMSRDFSVKSGTHVYGFLAKMIIIKKKLKNKLKKLSIFEHPI